MEFKHPSDFVKLWTDHRHMAHNRFFWNSKSTRSAWSTVSFWYMLYPRPAAGGQKTRNVKLVTTTLPWFCNKKVQSFGLCSPRPLGKKFTFSSFSPLQRKLAMAMYRAVGTCNYMLWVSLGVVVPVTTSFYQTHTVTTLVYSQTWTKSFPWNNFFFITLKTTTKDAHLRLTHL